MESFETREHGFESAFAHDQNLHFRIRMESLRRLGRWAAQTLKRDQSADALVARALQGADDETLLAEVARDLSEAGVSAHRIRARLASFVQEAARDIQAGAASGANHSTTRS